VHMTRRAIRVLTGGLLITVSTAATAVVSPEKAAEIGLTGTRLTPMGAIRAGNADGSIPAWEGGIATPPAGYQRGGWYIDPYADDKPLFKIDGNNYQQYADRLLPGTIALFQKYPQTFYMNVYPTRRSAAVPQWHYENSVWNASNTRFCYPPPGPDREYRCLDTSTYRPGVAFPIPNNGAEAVYNHGMYFFGKSYVWRGYAFNAFADGSFAETTAIERSLLFQYMTPEEKSKDALFTRNGGAMWCRSSEMVNRPVRPAPCTPVAITSRLRTSTPICTSPGSGACARRRKSAFTTAPARLGRPADRRFHHHVWHDR